MLLSKCWGSLSQYSHSDKNLSRYDGIIGVCLLPLIITLTIFHLPLFFSTSHAQIDLGFIARPIMTMLAPESYGKQYETSSGGVMSETKDYAVKPQTSGGTCKTKNKGESYST